MKTLEVEDSAQVHAAFLVYMDLTEGASLYFCVSASGYLVVCVKPGVIQQTVVKRYESLYFDWVKSDKNTQ